MGAASGLVAAPCGAPAFAAVLTYVAGTRSAALGFIYLLVFSFGMTALLIAVGLFSGTIAALPAQRSLDLWVKRAGGMIMLAMAEYYLIKMVAFCDLRAWVPALAPVDRTSRSLDREADSSSRAGRGHRGRCQGSSGGVHDRRRQAGGYRTVHRQETSAARVLGHRGASGAKRYCRGSGRQGGIRRQGGILGVNVDGQSNPDHVRRWVRNNSPPYRTLYDDRGPSVRASKPRRPLRRRHRGPGPGKVAYTGISSTQDLAAVLRRVTAELATFTSTSG